MSMLPQTCSLIDQHQLVATAIAMASTLSSWRGIMYTNNVAVGMLRQGQLDASISSLRQALERFHQELGHVHLLMLAPPHPRSTNVSSKMINNNNNISILSVELDGRFYSCDLIASPGNAFSIYNCAFCCTGTDPSEAATLLVVMLYNFALALHRQGLQQAKNEYLYQALSLYQMAVSLIQKGGTVVYNDNLRLLQLALWTNQGHVYSHFQQCDMVQVCHNNLRHTFTNPPVKPMIEQDHLFFLSTLISIPNMNMAPAA
jgi:hypothetical protein